nr:uncharacterized protein LOC129382804 [Dermacentor andersoni]
MPELLGPGILPTSLKHRASRTTLHRPTIYRTTDVPAPQRHTRNYHTTRLSYSSLPVHGHPVPTPAVLLSRMPELLGPGILPTSLKHRASRTALHRPTIYRTTDVPAPQRHTRNYHTTHLSYSSLPVHGHPVPTPAALLSRMPELLGPGILPTSLKHRASRTALHRPTIYRTTDVPVPQRHTRNYHTTRLSYSSLPVHGHPVPTPAALLSRMPELLGPGILPTSLKHRASRTALHRPTIYRTTDVPAPQRHTRNYHTTRLSYSSLPVHGHPVPTPAALLSRMPELLGPGILPTSLKHRASRTTLHRPTIYRTTDVPAPQRHTRNYHTTRLSYSSLPVHGHPVPTPAVLLSRMPELLGPGILPTSLKHRASRTALHRPTIYRTTDVPAPQRHTRNYHTTHLSYSSLPVHGHPVPTPAALLSRMPELLGPGILPTSLKHRASRTALHRPTIYRTTDVPVPQRHTRNYHTTRLSYSSLPVHGHPVPTPAALLSRMPELLGPGILPTSLKHRASRTALHRPTIYRTTDVPAPQRHTRNYHTTRLSYSSLPVHGHPVPTPAALLSRMPELLGPGILPTSLKHRASRTALHRPTIYRTTDVPVPQRHTRNYHTTRLSYSSFPVHGHPVPTPAALLSRMPELLGPGILPTSLKHRASRTALHRPTIYRTTDVPVPQRHTRNYHTTRLSYSSLPVHGHPVPTPAALLSRMPELLGPGILPTSLKHRASRTALHRPMIYRTTDVPAPQRHTRNYHTTRLSYSSLPVHGHPVPTPAALLSRMPELLGPGILPTSLKHRASRTALHRPTIYRTTDVPAPQRHTRNYHTTHLSCSQDYQHPNLHRHHHV